MFSKLSRSKCLNLPPGSTNATTAAVSRPPTNSAAPSQRVLGAPPSSHPPGKVKSEMVAFEPNGVWSNVTRHQGKIINELSTVIVSPASGAVESSSN